MTMIVNRHRLREDLPEDQSGTIPKWLASGTTYILVVIDELYLTTGLRMYYA